MNYDDDPLAAAFLPYDTLLLDPEIFLPLLLADKKEEGGGGGKAKTPACGRKRKRVAASSMVDENSPYFIPRKRLCTLSIAQYDQEVCRAIERTPIGRTAVDVAVIAAQRRLIRNRISAQEWRRKCKDRAKETDYEIERLKNEVEHWRELYYGLVSK